jgi:hypothetical protein
MTTTQSLEVLEALVRPTTGTSNANSVGLTD